jgi:hypothetical protein
MICGFGLRKSGFYILAATASALLAAGVAPGQAQQFAVSNTDGSCPTGYQLATPQQARAQVQRACGVLGEWYIARLAGGGSMDGRGYQCKIRDADTRSLGNSLCSKVSTAFTVSPDFPHDVTDEATAFPDVSFTDLALFAWKEFVALNYPADPNHRGQPLAGSKLTDMADARVWETFWHRVEVFPSDENPTQKAGKADVTAKPNYVYSPNAFTLDAAHFDSTSTGAMNNQLWNNLDEDSELDVDEMFGRAKTVNDFTDANRIVYEAKINEDAFNYILANHLYKASIRGPMLATGKATGALTAYGSTCGKAPAGQISQICGSNAGPEGHVEIKAAWRALSPAEMSSGKYYTQEVIHYLAVPDGTGTGKTNKWRVDTHGLIGLHIIHKTVNFPAFTYATFEHVDNIASGIGYIDELNQTGRGGGDTFGKKVLVTDRDNPIPAPVAAVNATAQAAIAGSVWANYQLTGIQAYPTDVSAPRTAATADMTNKNDNSSFFLSNIVIETNEELQNFTGELAGNTKDAQNIWAKGTHLNMGGCMGCHGVAQSKGADFSFLLVGAPFAAPEVVGATIGNITPFPVKSYADVQKMFNEYVSENPINIAGSPHNAFWKKDYTFFTTMDAPNTGIKIVQCGSSANSNLIALLRGDKPPHAKRDPGRMPAGGPYFPDEQINYLAAWVDAGCPETETTRKQPPKVEPSINELLAQGVENSTNYACQTLQGVRNSCGNDYISSVCPAVAENACATSCNCYNCALPTTVGKINTTYPSGEYLEYQQCQ